MIYCYLCQDSIEGIFTGIYDAWASNHGHANVRLICLDEDNCELFCQYVEVEPNSEKAGKVARTLRDRMGMEVYEAICRAILAKEPSNKKKPDKADCIYRTIVRGLAMKYPEKILQALGDQSVMRVFELSRSTQGEAHHLLGFLRFSELKNKVLFATIHPRNDVMPILGEHFTDRLFQEHFMIYDANRRIAAIHKKGKNFVIVDASDLNLELTKEYSESEEQYQQLWCTFFDSIAIEARTNPKLQSQNIPKRFWEDTVELANENSKIRNQF